MNINDLSQAELDDLDVEDLCNKNQHAQRFIYMKISLEIIESFYNIQNCYESNMQHANIYHLLQ